ncbi:MAG: hypothetical protein AAF791_09715 [Bacteroidota bacterium]
MSLVRLVLALVALGINVTPAHAQSGRLDQLGDIEAALADLSVLETETIGFLRDAGTEAVEANCTDAHLAHIQNTVAAFEEILHEETRLRASASFSYRDNQASGRNTSDAVDPERQAVTTSATISRGRYPLEFDLQTSVALSRTENGAINEDISSLFFSVDQNLQDNVLEGYAFLERSSDAFLSIDQRYETGAGVVLNFQRGLTREGRALHQRIEHGRTLARGEAPTDTRIWTEADTWASCLEAVRSAEAVAAARASLQQAATVATRSVTEASSALRVALLVGLQGEIEVASIDAFEQSDRGFRLVLRPTVAVRPIDGITARADWYVNVALSGFAEPETFRDQIERDFPVPGDVRSELALSFSTEVGGVELEGRHVRVWDTVPPFFLQDGEIALDADGAPVVAAWRRELTTFGVKVPF